MNKNFTVKRNFHVSLAWCKTTLLKGVFDTLIVRFRINFGSGIKESVHFNINLVQVESG